MIQHCATRVARHQRALSSRLVVKYFLRVAPPLHSFPSEWAHFSGSAVLRICFRFTRALTKQDAQINNSH